MRNVKPVLCSCGVGCTGRRSRVAAEKRDRRAAKKAQRRHDLKVYS